MTAMKGRRVSVPLFRLIFSKSWDNEHHVSVVVSKKVAKTAVMRNLIRRRMYDVIREILNTYQKRMVIVVFPTKEVATAPLSLIREQLHSLL